MTGCFLAGSVDSDARFVAAGMGYKKLTRSRTLAGIQPARRTQSEDEGVHVVSLIERCLMCSHNASLFVCT